MTTSNNSNPIAQRAILFFFFFLSIDSFSFSSPKHAPPNYLSPLPLLFLSSLCCDYDWLASFVAIKERSSFNNGSE
eukprot:m.39052 g.39052  ORF g.39052 m.39052 type:complete len:76 (+) comp6835_c0_seq1:338-565(+)